jgi:hypothetical protein
VFSRSLRLRTLAIVAPLAAAATLVVPGLAGADGSAPPAGANVESVHIEIVHHALKFVGPKAITEGDYLEVVNDTKASEVGPHTFSLVTKGSVPKTAGARKNCFTPKHICMAIAKWHGVKGEGPPKINPVDVGAEGWSTMGSLKKKGDSWFTGQKPKASIVQQVLANPGSSPKTIYFVCAVHPWMHGQITVLPAPTS